VVLLLLWIADPAFAAPRTGITVARGVPAEAVSTLGDAAVPPQALSAASIAADVSSPTPYLTIPGAAAWAIGVLGAIALIGGAWAFALAERRGRGGRPVDLTGREPAAIGTQTSADRRRDEERRKAA
jgi:hypothetical protein